MLTLKELLGYIKNSPESDMPTEMQKMKSNFLQHTFCYLP